MDVSENGIHGAGPTLSVDRIWRHVHDRLREQGCPAPQQFGQNAVTRRPWVHNRAHLDGPPAEVLLPRDP
ncbi:hypothetical protein [Embleya sp. NPDC059259]|uniref:hypothetical protein n=1 Tax=unclassified Embleya TaxID=2699296 RepID=UPI0036901990